MENDASNWKSAAIKDQIGRGQNDPFTMAPRSNVNAAIQGRFNPNSPSSSSSNGKYLSEESVHRVYGSTVVDISIPPPSFKPIALFFSRSPLSKTP